MTSLRALIKITGITGFLVSGIGYAFRFQIQNELCESKLYKDAMQYLYNNQKALDLLGTPIKERRVNLSDSEKNGTNDTKTWLTIPIMGSQNYGELRVEALLSKDMEKKLKADIYKVELTINEIPSKVLVMKDDSATLANKL